MSPTTPVTCSDAARSPWRPQTGRRPQAEERAAGCQPSRAPGVCEADARARHATDPRRRRELESVAAIRRNPQKLRGSAGAQRDAPRGIFGAEQPPASGGGGRHQRTPLTRDAGARDPAGESAQCRPRRPQGRGLRGPLSLAHSADADGADARSAVRCARRRASLPRLRRVLFFAGGPKTWRCSPRRLDGSCASGGGDRKTAPRNRPPQPGCWPIPLRRSVAPSPPRAAGRPVDPRRCAIPAAPRGTSAAPPARGADRAPRGRSAAWTRR